MQKIQTISKSKIIDNGNKEINNFWLKINNSPNIQEVNNNLELIISVFNEIQGSVICIQTEDLNHPELIKTIYNATKKRNRIYILTNEKNKFSEELEGVCLIRYGIKNIGSFILVNPNTSSNKGIVFTAPLIEKALANADNISLNLDNEQVKTLFRFFSNNFWNKAEYEIIEDYSNPKETCEPPLDFLPNIYDFCDANFVKSEISEIITNATISVSNLQTNDLINFKTLSKTAIFTSLKNNDTELLKTIAKNNNSINSNSQNSKRIILAGNKNWLIPKIEISENDNFFGLRLNKTQTEDLDKLINEKIQKAEFEFNLSLKRKNLENKTVRLLDDIENEIQIKKLNELNADNIILTELLSKEEFEKQEPEFVDDNISIEINYNWQIIPFFTPKNAKRAKLYDNWEKHQNEYNTFISQIEKAINESESKKVTEKLKRFFLSKKQSISKHQQELEEIKETNLSVLEISKRKGIIKKINELAKKVSVNLLEIDIEIKKSGIKTEIEELKHQKEEKELDLNDFIQEKETELRERAINKEQMINEFLEKNSIKKEDLAKYKSDLQRKKNKKKEKITEDQIILEELKNIEGFNFKSKFDNEKQNFRKDIKDIETLINIKEKELEKTGIEKQNNSSSINSALGKGQNNIDKKHSNDFSIPDIEYLPKIGKLFEIGNKKYLEIENWEDLEEGKIETQRFNAKLSAKN